MGRLGRADSLGDDRGCVSSGARGYCRFGAGVRYGVDEGRSQAAWPVTCSVPLCADCEVISLHSLWPASSALQWNERLENELNQLAWHHRLAECARGCSLLRPFAALPRTECAVVID